MTFQTETDFSFIPIATTATTATKQAGEDQNVAKVANVAGGERQKKEYGQGSLSQKSRMSQRGEERKKHHSPLSILRKAGLVPVLAGDGDSFEALGLENLPEDRREKCVRYYTAHRKEILSELRHEERYWKVFHLAWLRNAGLELSLDDAGQVMWTIREGFKKIWALGPEERLVNHAWECWRYACQHRHEILAALQPCKGWEPSQPSGGCATLEEFRQELEKERRRGVMTFCPFHDMWLLRKNCLRWCGKWAEPLTAGEQRYWAALWPEKKPSAA